MKLNIAHRACNAFAQVSSEREAPNFSKASGSFRVLRARSFEIIEYFDYRAIIERDYHFPLQYRA